MKYSFGTNHPLLIILSINLGISLVPIQSMAAGMRLKSTRSSKMMNAIPVEHSNPLAEQKSNPPHVLSQENSNLLPQNEDIPSDINQMLIRAAQIGNIPEVDHFIDKGADVNYQDEKGRTPLHHAVFWSHKELLNHLIHRFENTLDLDILNEEGNPALFSAIAWQKTDFIEMLISAGAQLTLQINSEYRDALVTAVEKRKWISAEYLVSYYNDINHAKSQSISTLRKIVIVLKWTLDRIQPELKKSNFIIPLHPTGHSVRVPDHNVTAAKKLAPILEKTIPQLEEILHKRMLNAKLNQVMIQGMDFPSVLVNVIQEY